MRKLFTLAAALAGMVAVASAPAGNDFASFVQALKEAKTLDATYTVAMVNESTSTNYTLSLKKPNLARIDSPTATVVADGKTITRYDKATKSYYKTPETESELNSLFVGQDLGLWGAFFGKSSLEVLSSKAGGTVNRKGMELQVVNANLDTAGNQKLTVLLAKSDNIARQAIFDSNKFGMKTSTILDTKSLTVGGDLKDTLFAFNPPAGSSELSADEMTGKRWYYDLAEAETVAARTGKKIFVDFFATWCGPCKMLAHDVLDTADFNTKMSKYFVFCRIDVDARQDIAKQYSIEAMPTQMVLDKNGAILGKTVGYGGADAFYQFINGFTN